MAVTIEGEVTGSLAAAAGGTVTIPGTPQQNDIVLLVRVCDAALNGATISEMGYTDLVDDNTANNPGRAAHWKRMGATPDSSITVAGEGTFAQSYICRLYRGVDTTTAVDNTPVHASGATGTPDCGDYTTVTNGARRILVGFLDDDSVAASAAPTDYGSLITANATGRSLMMAELDEPTAGADDPGLWTTAGNDEWYALHFAWRPATGGGGGQTVDADPASETEAAQVVGHSKARTIGISSETETAQAIGHSKSRAVGIASEIESALAIGHSKSRTIGVASEIETGVRLLVPQTIAVTAAEEIETAMAITPSLVGAAFAAARNNLWIGIRIGM